MMDEGRCIAREEGRRAVERMQAQARAEAEAAPDYDPHPAPRPPRRVQLHPDTVARHLARRRPAFTLGLTHREALELAGLAPPDLG